jgi:DNA modification methylase
VTAIVLRGDAAHLPLPDGSVDLICTSPPYWGLRSYSDNGEHYEGQIGSEETPAEYIAALLACTREWMRVLKPSGSLFVNLGDKYGGDKSLLGLPWRYAHGCVDDLGLILRRDIIWSKLSAQPESVTDRCATRHEYLFHLVKHPRYFAAVDEIREPCVRQPRPNEILQLPGGGMRGQRQIPGRSDFLGGVSKPSGFHPLGKLPGSVWDIPSQPLIVPDWLDVDHFAAFPMELPRRIILGWSPPSGIVVDPCGGTGTTALVADVLGRDGYSFDVSADYCRLARWRCSDPGERARALGVPKPPPVPEGQRPLFDLEAS